MLLDDSPPVDYERRDDLLAALVRLARTDTDAGQLLMVCLLPGLRTKLRRHAHGLDPDDAAAIAVAALWRRITGYPLDRRPRRIALNLLLDTTHDLITARDRERSWADHTQLVDEDTDLDQPDNEAGPTPELMWHAATTAQVLTTPQATMLDATHLRGLPLRDTAALLGLGHAAAKQARRRSGQRFARWWAPDDRRHAA
jgi:DNA-directed RNA polymerase specialized sigma24 family protein